jgi:phospholipid/cholesterol/gamma-HCH transport system substrate-binding protein
LNGNVIETVMGAVVLAVAAFFLFFAYSTSQVRSVSGYEVWARFSSVDGIRDGSDVRIAGVKVGTVTSESLDPNTYLATLKMNIDPAYKLPDDTSAAVVSSGLLGDKFLSVTPGGSEKTIPPGGQIKYTQGSISLESLIGQMMFTPQAGPKGGGGKPSGGAPSLPPPAGLPAQK